MIRCGRIFGTSSWNCWERKNPLPMEYFPIGAGLFPRQGLLEMAAETCGGYIANK